jgi:uncharacterized protein
MYIRNKVSVAPILKVPGTGVRLGSGVMGDAHRNNIEYLKSLSIDSILYWFRDKAGLDAPGEPYRGHFEDNIRGQTAGLFMMGAGNSLRWREDDELRRKLDQIVDTIDATKEADGFIEPIPKVLFGTKEYPNYVRVWLNYGLLAAHMVGNAKALPLMRGMQSWFNRCDERVIAKDLTLGFQGVISNTTVYLTEAGIQEDLDVTVEYYQENWWLAQLICRDHKAIYARPRPHGTELEAITAYMDLYIATGMPLYLNAVNGAYHMFKDKWQHVGGGILAIEFQDIEPGCYWLDPVYKYNELCCSAHWIYLNQRYHLLFPDVEEHVGEIEKSFYNVAIANQSGSEHIRYHAYIDTQKDENRFTPVSCCAGLGTRIFGSLPEFLYSTAEDGLYVDIYANSEITWSHAGQDVTLKTETDQPTGGRVEITVQPSSPVEMNLRFRIPGWAASPVEVLVNGEACITGEPGSYVSVNRSWNAGDRVSFELPMSFRVTKYEGFEDAPKKGMRRFDRYAYEFGPLLMAVTGPANFGGRYTLISQDPDNPSSWMKPVSSESGHFTIPGMPCHRVVPYHEIEEGHFTCYPIFG